MSADQKCPARLLKSCRSLKVSGGKRNLSVKLCASVVRLQGKHSPKGHRGCTENHRDAFSPGPYRPQLWLGPGCRRVQAAIEKHLHFNASILCASAWGAVIGDGVGLAVTHRGHKTPERNFMIYRQVLNHCFRASPAQPEIFCFTAG